MGKIWSGPSKDMSTIIRDDVLNFVLGPSKYMRFFQLSSIVAYFKKELTVNGIIIPLAQPNLT